MSTGAASRAQDRAPQQGKILRKKREKVEVTAEHMLGPHGFTKLAEDMSKLVAGWSQAPGNEQANLFSFLVVYDNWRKQLLPGMSFGDFLKQIEGLAGHVNIKETLEKMSEEIDEDAPPKQQNEEEDVDFQNAEDFGENEDFGLRRREEETPIRHPVRDVSPARERDEAALARIEENRRKAIERRKAALEKKKQQEQGQQPAQLTNTNTGEDSILIQKPNTTEPQESEEEFTDFDAELDIEAAWEVEARREEDRIREEQEKLEEAEKEESRKKRKRSDSSSKTKSPKKTNKTPSAFPSPAPSLGHTLSIQTPPTPTPSLAPEEREGDSNSQ